jgi:phage FluMu gp28-like protein
MSDPFEKPFAGKAKNRPKRDTLLLPYQIQWVRDASRLKLAVKSRQIGWTWATAFSIVERKCLSNARLDAWISSRDEIQARLFLEDCGAFAKLLDIAARPLGAAIMENDGASAGVLKLSNGRRIHSMSSNPDAQAGKRGDRVLDEFALHPDPKKLYTIAYPGITWGGSLEIFSTHRGSGSYFNTLVQEIIHQGNPKQFSLHTVTLQDALNQGLLYKLQRKLPPQDARQEMDEGDYFNFLRAGCPDEETFLQEYMCVPGDDRAAFLSYDLIAGCEYASGEAWEWTLNQTAESSRDLYLGVDIGRDHDLTVFWLLEKVGEIYFTRRIETLRGAAFDAQEEALDQLLRSPALRRCCVDQTGIGRQFLERAQQRHGARKVEGVSFTAPVKEELAYPVRTAFESKALRIPNDPLVRSDMRAIKKEMTSGSTVRFTADRGKNGHADRFWALALALRAGRTARSVGVMSR